MKNVGKEIYKKTESVRIINTVYNAAKCAGGNVPACVKTVAGLPLVLEKAHKFEIECRQNDPYWQNMPQNDTSKTIQYAGECAQKGIEPTDNGFCHIF